MSKSHRRVLSCVSRKTMQSECGLANRLLHSLNKVEEIECLETEWKQTIYHDLQGSDQMTSDGLSVSASKRRESSI